jgi:anti-sigma regulatory factor (Ser/Thr protein kinase)
LYADPLELTMARIDLTSLTTWVTAAATDHPNELPQRLAQLAGVQRGTALRRLGQLIDLQWLTRTASGRDTRYGPGLLRQIVHHYPLAGLSEDLPWSRDFARYFDLPPNVRRLTQHAFSELLNNAIDHSDGSGVTVSLRQTPSHVQLLVSDDGRGVFDKIRHTYALADVQTAMLELSKGKLTTQPECHTGHGLYFTTRLADVFDLHANEHAYQHRSWEGSGWRASRPMSRQGTSVYVSIALDTPRTLESVMHAHSLDGTGVGFERTAVPLQLVTSEQVGLESRAQARQVAARLTRFRLAEIDFSGIAHIGHSFADELFRVLPQHQAALNLAPINMSPAVAAMVDSVVA